MTMQDLSRFQRDLLFAVSDENGSSGQTILQRLEEYYDTSINHGQLYPNLDTLAELELIEKSQKDRRTNAYTLTDTGKEVLADRMTWEQNATSDIETNTDTDQTTEKIV